MMKLPNDPIIYEIHTAVWLDKLGADLASVPETELDRLSNLNINAVWLMGAWTRSPAAKAIDAKNEALQAEFKSALSDYSPDDAIGSAYAVKSYQIEPSFGGESGLRTLRKRLADKGIGLILDFVPNHTAPDHDWISTYPEIYIRFPDGKQAQGKDPHYEPWPDTLQLNVFSEKYRDLAISTLKYIASICDGVRCDMAMLLLNRIFAGTWGELAGTQPNNEFWRIIINSVKLEFPEFTFIAECYWNTEIDLLNLGFDYCYDKTLYDNLIKENPNLIENYLENTAELRPRLVAFTENHDEQRAASIMNPEKNTETLSLILQLSGMRLIHDGQLEGYKIKIPVQLKRGPNEQINKEFQESLYKLFE